MIEIRIDSTELNKALKNIGRYSLEKQQQISKQIVTSGFNIQRNARNNLRRVVKRGASPRAESAIRFQSLGKFVARVIADFYYAVFIEHATRPHIIRPKKKKALAWGRTIGLTTEFIEKKEHLAKRVSHPGTKAKPFMEPAAETERPKFINAIKQILKRA